MVSLLRNLQETNGNIRSTNNNSSCGVLARRLRRQRNASSIDNAVHYVQHGRSTIETSRRFLQRGLVSSQIRASGSVVNRSGGEGITSMNAHDSTQRQMIAWYRNEMEREELKMSFIDDFRGNIFVVKKEHIERFDNEFHDSENIAPITAIPDQTKIKETKCNHLLNKHKRPHNNHTDTTTVLSSNECTICLNTYHIGDVAVCSKHCNHVFHRDCILDWLCTGRKQCPNCRGEF